MPSTKKDPIELSLPHDQAPHAWDTPTTVEPPTPHIARITQFSPPAEQQSEALGICVAEAESDQFHDGPERPLNIWDRLRLGFQLPDIDNRRVEAELKWYVRHPKYLDRVIERATPYIHYVVEQVEKQGLPMEIALLPIVESAFQPFAYSHGRAAGIWQFIPSTGKIFNLKQNWWYDGRRDIVASTDAAVEYMSKLYRFVGQDWLRALAAYNAGAGTVNRAVKKNRRKGRAIDFWSLKLPKETQHYVPRLMALRKIFEHPEQYNLDLKAVENAPYFEIVETQTQMDLAMVAEMAEMELDDIYALNPGFNRWATDPDGPHYLVLPIEQAEGFRQQLAQLPADALVSWKRHRVKRGESLLALADRYDTTVEVIRQTNRLRGNTIRAGKHLVIPVASRSKSQYSLSADQRLSKLQNRGRRGNKVVYRVQSGDTFWNIARAHKVSVSKLAKWNGMAPKDPLYPGQKLVLWTRSKSAYRSNAAPKGIIRTVHYVVRKGDSLARISQKFKVSVADLKRWNQISGKYLQPGQRLKVVVDVTRQS